MKRIAWLMAIGLLVVSACAPQAQSTPTEAPAATPQPLPTGDAGPVAPTATPQEITREQVVQIQPGDWARGPENAAITIIEWGDFQ
jgi:hypothetical protein